MTAPWLKMKGGLKPNGKARQKQQPKRVRLVSKGRAKQLAVYRRLRKAFFATNPACALCGAPATDVHHMKGRSGKLLLNPMYWTGLCRTHHESIHRDIKAAYNSGLLLHGWNDPRIGT